MEWSTETFARNLQFYMERAGKNQKEMAEIVGVSAPTLHDWLRGKKMPRMNKVQKMSEYFGVSLSDLIEGNRGSSYDWIYNDSELLKALDVYARLPEAQKKAIVGLVESFEEA